MNYLSIIVRILVIAPLFFLIEYPFDKNPDYYNYYLNYINHIDRFDLGYTVLSVTMRDFLAMGFDSHWYALIVIELVLLFFVYNKVPVLILAIPNLILMSQFLYGTQIRYAIASLVFLLALNENNKPTKLLITASILHYGIAIPSLLYGGLTKKITEYLKGNRIKLLFSIIVLSFVVLLLSFNIFTMIENTRFSYFTPDSEFTSAKSLSSIIYVLVYWLALLVITQRNNVEFDKLLLFSMLLITSILATSSIAVLSGRLLLLFFMIEPFIAYRLIQSNENVILKLLPTILMTSKAIFMISSMDFY
ncbi:EpsG family protein [Vibrio sp. Sgm 5]|uniref:EpsG family protein n=1 Tax=Vibrio sp. Sgm 5 TaxID=2994387 RepID=UPI0022491571|nr:EpsG family protein [Vibrio sp. Sgm 5]MCX2792882.1 EpsG family protein [Vibrio sp. Sgm 5]